MRNLRLRLPLSLLALILAASVFFTAFPVSVSAKDNYQLYCTGSSVRIRDAAALSSNVLGYLNKNQTVDLLDDSRDGWAYVLTASGTKGYVSTKYLNITENASILMNGYASQNTAVYSDKSTYAQTVGSIAAGTTASIIDNSDSEWAKVRLSDGAEGYAKSSMLVVEFVTVETPDFSPDETPNIGAQLSANSFADDFVLLEKEIVLEQGETYLISPVSSTNYSASGMYDYASSNEKVASVSSVGMIKAEGAGECVITVASPFSGKESAINVTAEEGEENTSPDDPPQIGGDNAVGNFEIPEKSVAVYEGSSYTLTVYGNTDLKWTSSNESVATVSGGTIYGKSSGETVITASNSSGIISIPVKVTTPSYGGSVSHTSIQIPAGKSFMISCEGSDTSWSSDNTDIAQAEWDSVGSSSYAYIEGQKPGTTVVRGKSSRGNVSCMVTVTEEAPQRFAYTTPNSGYSGTEMTFIAITGTEQQAVRFEVSLGGESFTVYADEKTESDGVVIWKGRKNLYTAGKYTVKTYSQNMRGEWAACADGETDAFITSVTDPTITVCEEHRASDGVVNIIANYEGFLSEVTIDQITGADPTLGYGKVVGVGSSFYNHITRQEGMAYLFQTVNLGYYTKAVNNYLVSNGVKFNQQQFDALVSMTYNLGSGFLYDSDIMNLLVYGSGSGSAGTPSAGDEGTINGTYVAFRTGPSTNYDKIREFDMGEKVTLLSGSTESWYHVKDSYGREGYVYASYVTFPAATGRDLNNVNEDEMKDAVLVYHHAGKTCYWGLLYRRIDEMEIFFHGDYILDGRNNKYGYHYYCHLDSSFGVG